MKFCKLGQTILSPIQLKDFWIPLNAMCILVVKMVTATLNVVLINSMFYATNTDPISRSIIISKTVNCSETKL